MNVLSLFDGMSCGLIAFTELGIPIDRYVAYEIDKYAIQTSKYNFPNVEQMGDVFGADFGQFKGFDMVIGGSPCTYWSIAQSADKREREASGVGWELFSQYVRAIREVKPKFFLYENNKSMSNAIRQSISEAFGFEPICINSALVSAQNRQRLYWVGRRNANGTYSRVDVKQPEDKGILLKDILGSGLSLREKGYSLRATYAKMNSSNAMDSGHFPATMAAELVACRCRGRKDGIRNMVGNNVDRKTCVAEPVSEPTVECVSSRGVYRDTGSRSKKSEAGTEQRLEVRGGGKTNALTTIQKDNLVCEPILGPVRAGALPRPNGGLSTSQAMRVYSTEGKSVNLCSGSGGMGAKTGLYAIPVEFADDKPTKAVSCADGKTYVVYGVKDGQITIKGKQYPIKLVDGYYIIRKLTVSECKKMQTVPEWYEFPVSDTQAYKMLGNGWTVDVIVHLIETALKEGNDD